MPIILEVELEPGAPGTNRCVYSGRERAWRSLFEFGLPLRIGQKLAVIHPVSVARKSAKIVGIRRSQDSNGSLLAFEFDSPTPTSGRSSSAARLASIVNAYSAHAPKY